MTDQTVAGQVAETIQAGEFKIEPRERQVELVFVVLNAGLHTLEFMSVRLVGVLFRPRECSGEHLVRVVVQGALEYSRRQLLARQRIFVKGQIQR